MTPFRLAWLHLTRRLAPTLVALVAIAVSVAGSGILLRLYRLSGSRFSTIAKGGEAVVGAKAGNLEILLGSLNLEGKYPDFIPYRLFETLQAKRGLRFEDGGSAGSSWLRSVIPLVYFAKLQGFRVIGTDQSFFSRPDPLDSPTFAAGSFTNHLGEAVLGSEVARATGWGVGQQVSAQTWSGGVSESDPKEVKLVVTGVLTPTANSWDQGVYASIATAKQVLTAETLGARSIWGPEVLHYVLVYLKGDAQHDLDNLINRRSVAEAISVEEARQRLEDLTGTGRRLGILISLLILVLGGLSALAMMVTRFDAMTVQLAVLRALGFARTEIRSWLLWEGILLGGAACLVGALLDWLFFPLFRVLLGSALPPSSIVGSSIDQSWPVWIVALLATIFAVVLPLIRLYRQDVHLSLKGN